MDVRRIKDDELYHHGIKGQRWGVRRYQNPDGTLTDAGRKKHLKQVEKIIKQPYYVGTDSDKYFYEKIKNKTEYGKKVLNNKKVVSSLNKFKKANELNNYIENMNKEQWDKEINTFDKKLKEAGIKHTGESLDWSIHQIVCVNKGVDPRKYAKNLSEAQDNYNEAIAQETRKYFNMSLDDDKVQERIYNVKQNVINYATLSENKVYDPDMYEMLNFPKEDEKIINKLIKT